MVSKASSELPVEGRVKRGDAFVQFYRYVLGIGYERNVGGPERTIRYTFGGLLVLVGVGIVVFSALESALVNAVLALVLIVSGLYTIYEAQVQYCPLNQTIGRSTYSEE